MPGDLPGEAPQNTQILTGLEPLQVVGSVELGLSFESGCGVWLSGVALVALRAGEAPPDAIVSPQEIRSSRIRTTGSYLQGKLQLCFQNRFESCRRYKGSHKVMSWNVVDRQVEGKRVMKKSRPSRDS